jgi:hypothetical protein
MARWQDMPSLPRKTLPSRKGVKYAAYKDAKDRLRKARAITRRKELMHAALFMAQEIHRNSETPDPECEDEDEFSAMNWSLYIEHLDLILRLEKVVYARK